MIRNIIENQDHPYHEYVLKIFSELDPEVTRTMISSLLIDGTLIDEKLADEMLRAKRFVPALFSTGPTGR